MNTGTLYLITNYKFNHCLTRQPIDARFLRSTRNIVFFLIDKKVPGQLLRENFILEYQIDPALALAGKRFFAEWSFLLAEYAYSFCQYPFFTASSRFFEKNKRITVELDSEWDRLFDLLNTYGYGFLPSYDRNLNWLDTQGLIENNLKLTKNARDLISDLFGVRIPEEYRSMSDFFCNYIGFATREHLVRYVEFYLPLFHHCFDDHYNPKLNLNSLVQSTGKYRNEKPFTFILEMISHLFFFAFHRPFLGFHYDGYYEVNEHSRLYTPLSSLASLSSSFGPRHSWNYSPSDINSWIRYAWYLPRFALKRANCL